MFGRISTEALGHFGVALATLGVLHACVPDVTLLVEGEGGEGGMAGELEGGAAGTGAEGGLGDSGAGGHVGQGGTQAGSSGNGGESGSDSGGLGGASGTGDGGSSTSGGPVTTLPCGTGSAPHSWANWCMPNSTGEGPYSPSYDAGTFGIVTDLVTGLVWEQRSDGNYPEATFAGAPQYCAELAAESYGGFDDWRVPTRIELVSIVDYSRFGPAIDLTAFPSTPNVGFWSSTILAPSSKYGWEVNFEYGVVTYSLVDEVRRVRCVR